jgi:hypothetical protein
MAFVGSTTHACSTLAPLRDLLVRVGNTGVVRARCSAAILDERFHSILEQRPNLKSEALQRTRE